MEVQARYLALFLLLSGNWLLQVVLDGKSSQEYSVNAGVPQGPIHNDLPDYVICNMAIYADDITLYSKCE